MEEGVYETFHEILRMPRGIYTPTNSASMNLS